MKATDFVLDERQMSRKIQESRLEYQRMSAPLYKALTDIQNLKPSPGFVLDTKTGEFKMLPHPPDSEAEKQIKEMIEYVEEKCFGWMK